MSLPVDDPHYGFEDLFDDSLLPFSILEYRPSGEVAAAVEEAESIEGDEYRHTVFVNNVLTMIDHKLDGKPIHLIASEVEVATLLPTPKDLNKAKERMREVQPALQREVDGLFHMLAYSNKAKRELLDALFRKLRWKEKLKHSSKVQDACDVKLHISRLAYCCSKLQSMLMELVEEGAVSFSDHGFTIRDTFPMTSVNRAPFFRPLSNDRKIPRCDKRVFCKMKSLAFSTCDSRARFDVAASLEPEDFTQFLLNPTDMLTSIMRYNQLNYAEFIEVMFFMDNYGERVAPRCPCGLVIKVTSALLVMHSEPCGFRNYIRGFSTLSDSEGNIKRESNVVLTQQEEEYLKRLIIRRLPQDKWETSGLNKVLTRYMNGRDPQILKTIGPDSYELHRVNCSARASCRVCSSDSPMSKAFMSMLKH